MAQVDQLFFLLNSLMQEKPRNHLDLRNRLNSKGQREGKVIDYRYTTSIITHIYNDQKDAYGKYMLMGIIPDLTLMELI